MTSNDRPIPPGRYDRREDYLNVSVREALSIPLPEGEVGEGLALSADRGEIPPYCIKPRRPARA